MQRFGLPLLCAVLITLGCSGGTRSPIDPTDQPLTLIPPVVTLGRALQRHDIQLAATAIFTLSVDANAQTATIALREGRAASATDDLYLLSIGQFFKSSDLRIESIAWSAETLDLRYALRHPFPAPSDIAGPASAMNRADLGFAGMLLLLADTTGAQPSSYFTAEPDQQVVVNTALIANADSYYRPAGLLGLTGFTANAFPAKLVVDETLDPRTSATDGAPIANGTPAGNYDPANGWQRANAGVASDGWTGFGVLHGGQVAHNMLSLDRDALLAGPVRFDIALIAKYADPRGGATQDEQRANRLPADTGDITKFCYRKPHGALDVQRLRLAGASGAFYTGDPSESTLAFHVEDWDARATETTVANLADDPDPMKVAQGESGLPALTICIPGVLDGGAGFATIEWDPATDVRDDDSAFGGDVDPDSGIPGDALCYVRTIQKGVVDAGEARAYTGLVRAIDVEVVLADAFVLELGPNLLPLVDGLPRPESYQTFTVAMTARPNNPPTFVAEATATPNLSGTPLSITVSAYGDAEGDPVTVQYDWNDDGDFIDPGEAIQPLVDPAPLMFESPTVVENSDLIDDVLSVPYRVTDGRIAEPIEGMVEITLGPNRPPQITGAPELQESELPPPALFTLLAGTVAAVDPEGDPISYTVTNDHNADVVAGPDLPLAGNITPIIDDPDATILFTLRAHDALHPAENGSAYPALTGILRGCPCGWATRFGGFGGDRGNAIVVDPDGSIFIAGTFDQRIDFGGGPRNPRGFGDLFLLKLDFAGNYLYDREIGSTQPDQLTGLARDASGNLYLTGGYGGGIDFGGGPRHTEGVSDLFVLKLSADGNYLGDRTWGSGSTDFGRHVSVSPSGHVLVSAAYGEAIDFGNGTRAGDGSENAVLLKLDSNLVYVWDRTYGADDNSASKNYAAASIADASGNLYLAGSFGGTFDFGGQPMSADGVHDALLLKLDTDGNWLWGHHFGQVSSHNRVDALALLSDGSPAIGGTFDFRTDFGGGERIAGPGQYDAFIARYDVDGNWLWDRTYGGGGEDSVVRSLVVDASGALIAAGQAGPGSDFGGGPRPSPVPAPAFALKLDSAGVYQWDAVWSGSSVVPIPIVVALTGTGDVVAVGTFGGTLDFDPGSQVTELVSQNASLDIYITKFLGATGRW